MQATPLGAAPAAATAARTTDRGLGSLKSEDFFRILVSELQNQDPLEPSKTSDLIGQVSQIRSIELNGKLSGTLEQLTRQQRVAGAGDLIGKYVVARVQGPDGNPISVEGLVTGIQLTPDGVALLELDSGQTVLASDVSLVTTLDEAQRRAAAAQPNPLAALLGAGTSSPAPAAQSNPLAALLGLNPATPATTAQPAAPAGPPGPRAASPAPAAQTNPLAQLFGIAAPTPAPVPAAAGIR
jgi:flagellar basal-body rod modification protein FlgD